MNEFEDFSLRLNKYLLRTAMTLQEVAPTIVGQSGSHTTLRWNHDGRRLTLSNEAFQDNLLPVCRDAPLP